MVGLVGGAFWDLLTMVRLLIEPDMGQKCVAWKLAKFFVISTRMLNLMWTCFVSFFSLISTSWWWRWRWWGACNAGGGPKVRSWRRKWNFHRQRNLSYYTLLPPRSLIIIIIIISKITIIMIVIIIIIIELECIIFPPHHFLFHISMEKSWQLISISLKPA